MSDDLLDRLKIALADRYTVERELGRGGMATVYLAHDLKHDRKIAVKVLHPELTAVLGAKRFLNEIRVTANLQHPHILPLHDSGEAGGFVYYVMPYVDGESLRDRLERENELSIDEAVRIATAVAGALDYAHRRDVIHRDIKPENILLQDGQPVVADFGIALAVSAAGGSRLTETGLSVGTPHYMSPEQAMGDREVDGRSDIYSLGCLLYEMLAGEPPFTGPTVQSVIFQHVTAEPPGIGNARRDVPPSIERAIARALEKEPGDRFASASELAEAVIPPAPLPAVYKRLRQNLRQPRMIAAVSTLVILVALAAAWLVNRSVKARWAREEAVPEVARLIEQGQYPAAFALAREAERFIPADPMLAMLWPDMSRYTLIDTDPPGAEVYVRDYDDAAGEWMHLGTTPIDSVRIPRGYFHWRFERGDHQTLEVSSDGTFSDVLEEGRIRLPELKTAPPRMVLVRGGEFGINTPRLRHLPGVRLGDYWIDKYEVTNREFKEFLDAGGYRNPDFWKHSFVRDGVLLSWEEAMDEFRDATGRPGPAYWELGDYPDGQDEFPVTGVSWYEAAAYLESVGKSLPTVYHWNHAAGVEATEFIVATSNFSRSGPAGAGAYQGLSPYGTYDMAGNVKEWCWNGSGDDRYIMGGAWNEPSWLFNEADTRPPFERSPFFGFRGVIYASGDDTTAAADSIQFPSAGLTEVEPLSDEIYQAYAELYSYDRTELNPVVESVDEGKSNWRREKVSFDAAYGDERVTAYLFLPRSSDPPYQTVIYFPGSSPIYEKSSDDIYPVDTNFLAVNGRAVMFPVYKGTFERSDRLNSPFPNNSGFYRDHVVMWAKDLGRSIDYLETRQDIDAQRLAFMGNSWGGAVGPILTAVEPRIKVTILLNGGLFVQRALPAADQITFVPRVTVPVLMLNGTYDHVFPVESSQSAMFEMLATPRQDKRHVLYETGHELPRLEKIREVLDWLDRYLGQVE